MLSKIFYILDYDCIPVASNGHEFAMANHLK
jgi:hypothetical protein